IAGEVAIDILITALTVGLGATVASGRKIRLLDKFKKLGPLFEKLAEAVKKRKKHSRKAGQTGGVVPEQLERPQPVDVDGARKKVLDDSIQKKRVSPGSLSEVKKLLGDSRSQL